MVLLQVYFLQQLIPPLVLPLQFQFPNLALLLLPLVHHLLLLHQQLVLPLV
jgi:hypothetical protein